MGVMVGGLSLPKGVTYWKSLANTDFGVTQILILILKVFTLLLQVTI